MYVHLAAAVSGLALAGVAQAASLPDLDIVAVAVMAGTLIGGQAVVWVLNYRRDTRLFAIGAPIRDFDSRVERARAIDSVTSMLPRAPR